MKTLWPAVVFTLTLAANAAAQNVVFVVRHAERADAGSSGTSMMATDPELSDAGRARADALAATLKDAGITAIFTTEFKRTKATAAPLASALGITPTVIGSREHDKLIQAIKRAAGSVLVVGHSNTVPAIIKELGASTPVTVGDSEYDNLFIVTPGASPRVLRLHFR
jgi:broad specificity phosphatase PhoE